jgi:penicillin-binding protein 2
VIGLVAAGLFVALFARLYSLQILQAPYFRTQASANQVREISIAPPRGLILDRDQNVLVGNKVIQEVTLSNRQATLHPAVVGRLAKVLGMTTKAVQTILNFSQVSAYQGTPIKAGISISTAIYLEEHSAQFPGVSIQQTTERKYTSGDLAAQILGYVGQITPSELKANPKAGYTASDQVGQAGVEQSFEKYLRGKPGGEKLSVNASGDVVGVLSKKNPTPGGNLQLTISSSLQKQAENDLAQQINTLAHTANSFRINASRLTGAVVIENPNDGSIYAMASYPTYNPALFVGGISQANYNTLQASANYPMINRAISGAYTPGSTFKLATASAALNDGLISPYTLIHDPGYFDIPNCKGNFCQLHNSGFESLGNINVVTALSASDDVFFYTLGYDFYVNQNKYGLYPIQNEAAAYGWGKPTGIQLPGESPGTVDSLKERQLLHKLNPAAYPYANWYVADQLEMAFGQGETTITPLQMANAYATFANGGTRYVPRIAEGVVNNAGQLIKQFKPQVAGHAPLPSYIHNTINSGFEGAVLNGTAGGTFAGFPLSTFPLAGKTGTASVAGQAPNSWFVAYGPTTHPQYVIAAVVTGGGFGATGAAPIVRNLFSYLISHPVTSPTYGVHHLSAGSTTPQDTTTTTSASSSTTTSSTSTTSPAG